MCTETTRRAMRNSHQSWEPLTPAAQGTPPDIPTDRIDGLNACATAPNVPTDHGQAGCNCNETNLEGATDGSNADNLDQRMHEDEGNDDDDDDIMPTLPPETLPLAAFLSFHHVKQQTQSPLFQLPYEMRSRIWEMTTATHNDSSRPYHRRLRLWRSDNTGLRHVDTALLLTCRAAYSEAWDLPLRQTPLVIFDVSEGDRPSQECSSSVDSDATQFLLQSWQVLLLQSLDMTVRQLSAETGGVTHWIREFGNARSIASGMVSYFAQENEGKLHQHVVKRICNRPIQDMVVELNRRDWGAWKSEPLRVDKDSGISKSTPEGETQPSAPVSSSRRLSIPAGWKIISSL